MNMTVARALIHMRSDTASVFTRIRQSLPSPAWQHAVRTCLTAMLALYLAFLFQMKNPGYAATTVLIVAHPMPGFVWSKAFYRTLGTVIGGIVAILFADWFAQNPITYLFCFSLWMGACMALSTLIRNFRAYAAILAGYTVSLLSFPGVATAPDQIYNTVINRVGGVLLGVLVTAVISSLMKPGATETHMQDRMDHILRKLMRHTLTSLTAPETSEETIIKARQDLRGNIAQLDSLVEFGAAESLERNYHVDRRRSAILGFYSTLTALGSMIDALTAAPRQSKAIAYNLNAFCHELRRVLAAGHDLSEQELRHRNLNLIALRQRILDNPPEEDITQLHLHDRLCELIDGFATVMTAMLPPNPAMAKKNESYIAYHHDWAQAGICGLRAWMAIWAIGAVWLGTGWSKGGFMMGSGIPNVILLSTRDRPDIDIIEFIKGTIISSALVLIELTFFFPHISNYFGLILMIAPVFAISVYFSMQPGKGFIGFSTILYFLILLWPTNPMHYDMGDELNQIVAMFGACIIPAIILRVVLPPNPHRQARILVQDILDDLQILLRGKNPVAPEAWESRLQDRLMRLASRLRAAHLGQNGWLRSGFSVLRMGREIIRLRNLVTGLEDLPEAQALLKDTIRHWRRSVFQPETSQEMAEAAAESLHRMMADQPPKLKSSLAQAAMALTEISLLIGREHLFLQLTRRHAKEA